MYFYVEKDKKLYFGDFMQYYIDYKTNKEKVNLNFRKAITDENIEDSIFYKHGPHVKVKGRYFSNKQSNQIYDYLRKYKYTENQEALADLWELCAYSVLENNHKINIPEDHEGVRALLWIIKEE